MKKLRLISSLAAVILALGMYSCDNEDGVEPGLDDEALIAAIESATNKVAVDSTNLPGNSLAIIGADLAEGFMSSAALAPELGYEVNVIRESGALAGTMTTAFFDLNGRELLSERQRGDDAREERRRRRLRDCFSFVYPLSLEMPDDLVITLDSAGEWSEVKRWYQANPDVDERPSFIFPLQITFGDRVIDIENQRQLHRARTICDEAGERERCFRFVFPITFTMPDDSSITLESGGDWTKIVRWYNANPDADERPDLVYPIEITFKNGTTVTVNNNEEMLRAIESCND